MRNWPFHRLYWTTETVLRCTTLSESLNVINEMIMPVELWSFKMPLTSVDNFSTCCMHLKYASVAHTLSLSLSLSPAASLFVPPSHSLFLSVSTLPLSLSPSEWQFVGFLGCIVIILSCQPNVHIFQRCMHTAWCRQCEMVLWRHWMHEIQVHSVTSENQFHCTRLYFYFFQKL